ncbi:MAG TPA: HAMP domain-containing sensor histidine kinase [Candidatus Nitrosopolaris sp.]|nr:HAMP domain-containing sensor histidine kinase [Candidatus Nitrosopolaris sp.]
MNPVTRTVLGGLIIAAGAAAILWTLAKFRLEGRAPRGELGPWTRAMLRAVVTTAGIALILWSVFTFRLADWPKYATFVLLSAILYLPAVEVLPSLTLPIPGLAVIIGFLYVIGPPILVLRNVSSILTELVNRMLPARWKTETLRLRNEPVVRLLTLERRGRSTATSGIPADWAEFGQFTLGLGIRWWIVTTLAAGGRPTAHPVAMAVAELAGYAAWGVLSLLPIYRYNVFYSYHLYPPPAPSDQVVRTALQDMGLIHLFALTPFVFLIAYGYESHGLTGAAAWSLAALGPHLVLKRLNERRVVVEEQNRRLEALNRELEHRERLSAIGKMSSVVSHQMLQQIGLIGIHADLIRHADGGADLAGTVAQAKANAAAIEEALGGVNRVLRDLLVFSRDLRLNLYEHRLIDVLSECVEECRAQAAGRGVAIDLECPSEPTVTLDKLKMKQAVVNVLRNAIEASPRGSSVVVRGEMREGWVQVAVMDHGAGIPVADREKVFTPFFTTKEQGTGLGLAIAREFTEAHGGRIAVEGGEGTGATFVIHLPERPAVGTSGQQAGR